MQRRDVGEAVVGQRLLHPAGPLQGQQLAGVARLRRHDLPLGGREARVQQVGPSLCGTTPGLLEPPGRDRGVVAGQQHRGHVEAAPRRRPGVDGVLQQPVLVRLLDQRLGVAHEPGQQPDHRLGDRHGRDLAAVEDVVAERDLDHLGPGRGVVEHALVDALVATAEEHQPLPGRQLAGQRLAERRPGRRGYDDRRAVDPERVERLAERLGRHHHAGAAAERRVVDGAVPVVGPLPQVVDVQLDEALVARPCP